MTITLSLPTADATENLGAALASHTVPTDLILLKGNLGAGKTTLARGFIRKLMGAGHEVTSPTFNLVHCYDAPEGAIWHFDLYRLNKPEELRELGLDDALKSAISLIEWPEIALPLLPEERLEIQLETKDGAHAATLTGTGKWKDKLNEIRKAL